MKSRIPQEFGNEKPIAFVLDDSASSRKMISLKMKSFGFEVRECATFQSFFELWLPGTADVIIADWELSEKKMEHGDFVLKRVRELDWDVPFVLISGRLDEASVKAGVLEQLLGSSGANFVKRGEEYNGIARACEEALKLISRRDQTLLKIILPIRKMALTGVSVNTTTGKHSVLDVLADLVKKPSNSQNYLRPVAEGNAKEKTKKLFVTAKKKKSKTKKN